MKNSIQHIAVILLLLGLIVCKQSNAQFYYGLQQEFGKNRVQYQDFFWSVYDFERFETFFYKEGREIAQYVSRIAVEDLEALEELLDYQLEDKLQLVVYNNLTDFKQSNVNRPVVEGATNTGGLSKIVGSRLYVYFSGDHRKLRQDLRAGIAEVLIQKMMYGGNLREAVSSSALLSLPEWFDKGLVAFLSDPSDFEYEQKAVDGVLSGRYDKFKNVIGVDAIHAGFSIWKYIADIYGLKVFNQILYMTRVNRNIESGFSFVLGKDLKSLINDWLVYTKEKYPFSNGEQAPKGDQLGAKNKVQVHFSQPVLNPKNEDLAYVRNYIGRYKVYIRKSDSEEQVILKGGYAIDEFTDYSYPLLAWHPNGEILALITEEKGHCKLRFYNIKDKSWVNKDLFQFEKVLSFTYSPNGRELLVSAIRRGQSDIYMYSILGNSFEKLTDDIYDDFDPVFLKKDRFVFVSNRPDASYPVDQDNDTILVEGKTDLYLYDVGKKQPMRQLTFTKGADEVLPQSKTNTSFHYLSQNGSLQQGFEMQMDSAISFIDTITHYKYDFRKRAITNFDRSVFDHARPSGNKKIWKVLREGKEHLWSMPLDNEPYPIQVVETDTYEPSILNQTIEQPRSRGFEVDIEDYQFHPDLKEQYNIPDRQVMVHETFNEELDTLDKEEEFLFPPQSNYRLTFMSDYFVSQLDRSFTSNMYQAFMGGGAALSLSPPTNMLFKIGLEETFGNYRLVGAVRMGFNFRDHELYISFQDLKNRLDKSYDFARKVQLQQVVQNEVQKVQTHKISQTLSYPFSPVSAVKLEYGIRYDRIISLALDFPSAVKPIDLLLRSQILGSWVFDNTISKGTNLYAGSRFKLFGEYYQNLDQKKGSTVVLGMDLRYYYPIHKNFIFANRFAASSSFGNQRLIYFMGGVDNWWFPVYNPDISIFKPEQYAFQTLATNMRGFHQNIRNGNSFFVYNSELRFPLFSYLFNRPLKSDMLNNFQIVAFADLGTAWNGRSPYSEENALNIKEIKQGGVTVVIDPQKNPLVLGYGYGLRTKFLGYFVRLDWAWGLEDGRVLPRVFYLSTTLDF